MNRNSTLIGLCCLFAILHSKPSAAINYVDNGTATTYTLNTGDSLHIASGTYTGTISSFAAGAKISVAVGATFQPTLMEFPNVRGTMYVYGTFRKTTPFRSNDGFRIYNYGNVWLTSTTTMSGSNQVWTNYFNSTFNFTGDVSMTNNNSIINHGTINCAANLTMTGTTSITNKLNIYLTGNYQNNGGILTNEGLFRTTGSITFNAGLAIVYNHCRMISEGGIHNTTGSVNNYGYMWANNSRGLGNIVNSGTITNGSNGRIHSVNFNNTGTVNGAGYMYFTGYTTTTNAGTTGVTGITTDTIKFYDITRSNGLTIYDNQTGIVRPNVVYRAFTAPDSARAYFGGCSSEMVSQIPLAVEWNYFFVSLIENTPGLNWKAKSDPGTNFQVQRSYDGRSFYTIQNVSAINNTTEYRFSDMEVNKKSPVVYYRILAVEPHGTQKYSETRTVKFNNSQPISVFAAPNPFTSNFTINYQSTENGTITIRLFNMTGQQQLNKTVTVNNSHNGIVISEAANLPKGVYMMQVSKGNKVVSAEKIIKQ
jgi:Secretion system C-terminal sorting domain